MIPFTMCNEVSEVLIQLQNSLTQKKSLYFELYIYLTPR